MKILIKRVYEIPSKSDGLRVLIDRLWPRGVSKINAKIDLWLKDLTPSNELRSWYHENKEQNFKEFIKSYKQELKNKKKDILEIKKDLEKKKLITFVTAVKDIEHSHVNTLVNLFK